MSEHPLGQGRVWLPCLPLACIWMIGLAALLIAASRTCAQPTAMHLRILVVQDATEARKVAALLAQGEPFARLASTHSIHVTKKRGGRLGRVGLNDLQEHVRARISRLEVGAFTGPVQTREGLAFFQRTTMAYYAEGVRLMRAKRYQEALIPLADDLALNPDRPHSLELKAYAHEQLGQTSEAETAYWNIVLRDPQNVLARNNLGALFERSGRYAGAARLFEQAIILDPTQDVILYNLAWLYAFELSDLEKALGFIQRAVEHRPDTARYHALLGKIYRRQGEQQQARLAIAKAVELAPHEAAYRDDLASLGTSDTPQKTKKTAVGLQPVSSDMRVARRRESPRASIKVVVHPGGAERSRRIVQRLQQNGFAIDRQIQDGKPWRGVQLYHKPHALETAQVIRDLIDPALQLRRLTWSSQFDMIIYAGR